MQTQGTASAAVSLPTYADVAAAATHDGASGSVVNGTPAPNAACTAAMSVYSITVRRRERSS